MEDIEKLKNRVEQCRKKLNKLEIKSARHYFIRKYPEYTPKNKSDEYRIENLWFGKSTDEDFTKKLESFTKYKELEFKN